VRLHLRAEFPGLVSYTRFVEYIPTVLLPLCGYLRHCFGTCTGISFVDATALAVCNNRRIGQHKVFRGLAQRGKTSMGWFFGFKLHLLTNDRGELLNIALTTAPPFPHSCATCSGSYSRTLSTRGIAVSSTTW
jgi:hypothetical protein